MDSINFNNEGGIYHSIDSPDMFDRRGGLQPQRGQKRSWYGPVVIRVDETDVGCGSAIRISNVGTGFKLHSHRINYGTGSGQQVVSAINDMNDPKSLWIVKEPFGDQPCPTGKRVACGQRVRLEHMMSGKNLHSDAEFKAPFSLKQEVSLFGSAGDGDIYDDWVIECTDEAQDFIKGGITFMLRHAETERYLHTESQYTYNQENCRNCPIIGQREVCATLTKGRFSEWRIVGVT